MKKVMIVSIQIVVILLIVFTFNSGYQKYHKANTEFIKANSDERRKFKEYFYNGTVESINYGCYSDRRYVSITVVLNNERWLLIREECVNSELIGTFVLFKVIKETELLSNDNVLY